MTTVGELKAWLNERHHHDDQRIAIGEDGLDLQIASTPPAVLTDTPDEVCDTYEIGMWPDPDKTLRTPCCANPTKVVLHGSADASGAACGADWPEEN